MSGKWVTRAAVDSKLTVQDVKVLGSELVTLLIRGQNTFGDAIYSYVRLPADEIYKVEQALSADQGQFFPSHYGEVLAAGRGEPSEEIREEVGAEKFTIAFEKKHLPNRPHVGQDS